MILGSKGVRCDTDDSTHRMPINVFNYKWLHDISDIKIIIHFTLSAESFCLSRVSFVVHRFVCGVLDGPKGVGRGDDVAPSSYNPCHFELVI